MEHKHASTKHYILVYVGLLALTALSFGLSWLPLGAAHTPAALVIAVVKSTLVVLFFMHLLEQRTINALVLFTTIFFIALLASLMAADVATRITTTPAPIIGITGP
ncbi:MAG TPA: cytochrome C oxidase subunit IV family protein [Candidatus Nanopelagicales bacterium]|nr:cytochrome C oxidase subunit IV family protein [Candidatus Nanopelagicales bacterium]